MDISGILRPDELPFPVTEVVESAINDLLAAWERDDMAYIDCYLDEVHAAARDLPEEDDAWVRWYYVGGGWSSCQGEDSLEVS